MIIRFSLTEDKIISDISEERHKVVFRLNDTDKVLTIIRCLSLPMVGFIIAIVVLKVQVITILLF